MAILELGLNIRLSGGFFGSKLLQFALLLLFRRRGMHGICCAPLVIGVVSASTQSLLFGSADVNAI
jgi:hypothetical protein